MEYKILKHDQSYILSIDESTINDVPVSHLVDKWNRDWYLAKDVVKIAGIKWKSQETLACVCNKFIRKFVFDENGKKVTKIYLSDDGVGSFLGENGV